MFYPVWFIFNSEHVGNTAALLIMYVSSYSLNTAKFMNNVKSMNESDDEWRMINMPCSFSKTDQTHCNFFNFWE